MLGGFRTFRQQMKIEIILRCYWCGHDREPRRSRVKDMV